MRFPVYVFQPPFTQLNGPYPAGAYLSAFFRTELSYQGPVRFLDISNLFFRSLFSSKGVREIFRRYGERAASLANEAAAVKDAETAFQLRRYLSLEEAWVLWMDDIVSILAGGDRELCHAFVFSPHSPRGARMDAFLSGLDSAPTADDARFLATLAVEDFADFITAVVDSEFSLVRYAESISMSERSFARVETALSRPLITDFFEPYLEELWESLALPADDDGSLCLFLISIPFPGVVAGALAIARSLKRRLGEGALVLFGGGYVNTELRTCDNADLRKYADHLVFDRGYGALMALFEQLADSGRDTGLPFRLFCPPQFREREKAITAAIIPDYEDLDFSLYPRLADTANPMHRLWSDGAWIKAYLAHGCYWHRCSFCDVSLDYIAGYRGVNAGKLYSGLRAQCLEKGVRGIHLVDEAAPPRLLRDFALANLEAARREGGGLLSFWGNIRFEKTFTRDLADFLAAGGLAAVSGGIEIASPEGFKSVDKGIDLENLVAVCAAFKEAGVLVHAYLIYGYWNEDAQGVIDSTEVMRQMFASGLVDSAFWHKFVLTRHSRVYTEWKGGKHGGTLRPVDSPGDFADNDLRFEGEDRFARYTAPLDAALRAWMDGEGMDRPVVEWFPFSMPRPRIDPDLIGEYIGLYEKRRDAEREAPFDPRGRWLWTAGKPVLAAGASAAGPSAALRWMHLGEEVSLTLDADTARLLSQSLSRFEADLETLSRIPRDTFAFLRHHGLVRG